MRVYPEIGFQIPDILIPAADIAKEAWAVIACDQFTSQPEYWEQVKQITENLPSTYHMVLPEAYLGKPEEQIHSSQINASMSNYLQSGIFQPAEGLIFVERIMGSKKRHGLIAALDLEQYDFGKDSQSLIRATEGTIIDRLPPRIKIRKNASLEVPHIMVLIDDPIFSVIEPIADFTHDLPKLYDFDLMLGGGHLNGFLINNNELEKKVVDSIKTLVGKDIQKQKYQFESACLLFAVGDGNHSLATAKSIWESIKHRAGPNHPARYALVEIVNIHSSGIEFGAIHRLVKNFKLDIIEDISQFFLGKAKLKKSENFESMIKDVNNQANNSQFFGIIYENNPWVMELLDPPSLLSVGSLQQYLDDLNERFPDINLDFIHGENSLLELSRQTGNIGFFLPVIEKSNLFKSIIKDGPLPKKTFSMGEAQEKRYYFECRKIQSND
jgi:hypothetical protein